MAIVGYEAIIIGIILVVIFIWGPNKIPEIARSLGRARKEFEEASRGLNPIGGDGVENVRSDALIDTARKLGIDTVGRTRQEISDEIVKTALARK